MKVTTIEEIAYKRMRAEIYSKNKYIESISITKEEYNEGIKFLSSYKDQVQDRDFASYKLQELRERLYLPKGLNYEANFTDGGKTKKPTL